MGRFVVAGRRPTPDLVDKLELADKPANRLWGRSAPELADQSVSEGKAESFLELPDVASLLRFSAQPSEAGAPDFKVLIRDEATEATAEYTASELDDKIFDTLWALWKTPGENGALQSENIIEAFVKNVHIVGLKDPSEALLSTAGVPGASFWSSVIQEAPIGIIDKPLLPVERLVLIGGIIAGFASGHLGMAYSCLKALLHSEAHSISEKAIERLLTGDHSNSTGGNESPNRSHATSNAGSRGSLFQDNMVMGEADRIQREQAAKAEQERIRQRRVARSTVGPGHPSI